MPSERTVNIISGIVSAAVIGLVILWAIFGSPTNPGDNPGDNPPPDPAQPGEPGAHADPPTPGSPPVPPGYTAADSIPAYKSVAEMGADHPRIFLDGHKLDYDSDFRQYVFSGTDVVAAWIEYAAESGQVPVRQLTFPSKVENGVWWRFNGKQWVKDEKSTLPKPPPPPKKDARPDSPWDVP